MEISSKNYDTSTKNGKTSYNMREEYEDGSSKSVNVREVENGFIVCINKHWYEGEGDKKEYKYEEKEYISEENPLKEKKKEKEDEPMTSANVAAGISTFLSNMSNKLLV